MILESLSLTNFRNFDKLKLDFNPEITVILGPNASGKTNILEAIHFLSLAKTFRPGSDFEVVNFSAQTAYIKSQIKNSEDDFTLEVGIQKGDEFSNSRKKYSVNGISKLRSNFIGSLKVILFTPADLEMVDSSPSTRRAHIDDFLSQANRDYHRILSSYEKTVTSRNRLLRRIFEGKARQDELFFWDQALVRLAQALTKMRADFFAYLEEAEEKLDDFTWVLKSSKVDMEKLEKERGRDIACQATLSGPHRDDFRFNLSDRDLSFFGSRGQQRMSILNLKLLELSYLKEKSGVRPILLLDDIFSELDEEHQKAILPHVLGQTIISTTDLSALGKKLHSKASVFAIGT